MWFEILKKDLVKQKGVNIILFLFITLSTVFLASSVSNIRLVANGVGNYMERANVSDVMVVLGSEEEKEQFEDWLKSRGEVTEYAYEQLCEVKADHVTAGRDNESIKAEGVTLYLGYTGGQYAKPLDYEGKELMLKEGEVALPPGLLEKNGLQIGDKLQFHIDNEIYSYTIAAQSKDIMYGNEMSGMSRFVFDKSDYDKMTTGSENIKIGIYGFNTTNREMTLDAMNRQGFEYIMSTFDRDIYPLLYVFDMIVAALLIVIGICLILISLMILRFSLIFTMEENYREIGVMKAIGMRNFSIRKIYVIKYLALVAAGALIGFFASIPAGNMMMESVSKNMVLGDTTDTLGINLICSAAIVVFVTGMCILFTGKLKKVSAIEAIRNGGNGERYHKRKGLKLYNKKWMGTVSFLGLNDILCNKKRYLVLFLTFCISFVLITVPLNTLTTMESDEMAAKFNLDPKAAVYMETIEAKGDSPYHNTKDLERALRRVEREMAEKGYEAKLSVGALFFMEFIVNDDGKTVKYLTNYPIGTDGSYCEYEEGEAPKLENEVAFSKKVMEANHLHIGDTVLARLGGKEQLLMISGYYSDYMQLGESARLNPAIDMSDEIANGYWKPIVEMETDLTQQELSKQLEKEFPQYDWVTAQEVVDANVGSVKDTMRAMQLPMTMMLCILIMLISLLMMKLFIVREKGQLAMLKSIGWRNSSIRSWLVMRMVWVVILSMIFAVPLSMLCNRFVLRTIFAIMGAELQIQVEPLKAYLLYPAVLLVGIIMATVFATGSVKKITTSDMKIAE
ncbi:MAG: ABC transporter permease [Lachnospiraceae bacterium]|nr:ABC transporter permease [Lachnospiraceae bacterium]